MTNGGGQQDIEKKERKNRRGTQNVDCAVLLYGQKNAT